MERVALRGEPRVVDGLSAFRRPGIDRARPARDLDAAFGDGAVGVLAPGVRRSDQEQKRGGDQGVAVDSTHDMASGSMR